MSSNFLVSRSKAFRDLISKANRFSRTDFPVLLVGETGAGKEVLARKLHEESLRSRSPFIPINCAAIPHGLFESELFGYDKGSFSGALNTSKGLLKSAHGGTVFLDEIGDLDLSLQVKLLRFLDSGEVRSVGSQKTEHVDVRIIAATNVNLHEAVARKQFRLDLLERLSVLYLQVPPLRERKEDLSSIVENISQQIGAQAENGLVDILETYDWPGNVRQLKNILIRAMVLGGGLIKRETVEGLLTAERDLCEQMTKNSDLSLVDGKLEDIEKQVIVERLKRYAGNKKRTAKELGIAKSTLHEKLRRWTSNSEALNITA